MTYHHVSKSCPLTQAATPTFTASVVFSRPRRRNLAPWILAALFSGCTAKALLQPRDVQLFIDVSESARNLPGYNETVEQACQRTVSHAEFGGQVQVYLFADAVELVHRSKPQNIMAQRQICTELPDSIQLRQIGIERGTSLPLVLTAVGSTLNEAHRSTVTILLDRNESGGGTETVVPMLNELLPQSDSLTLMVNDYTLQQELDQAINHPAFNTCPFKAQRGC